jgi:hypothetical protein
MHCAPCCRSQQSIACTSFAGYVLHRALTTIDNSRSMEVRMAKLPPGKALDLYYRNMLGEDYGKQIEQDLVDAVKEVEEGLLTGEQYVV